MALNEADDLQLLLRKLQECIPNFLINQADLQRPSSQFVINLYTNLINRMNEETAAVAKVEDSSSLTMMINSNDEENNIFNIYNYIYHVLEQFGYQGFFSLTDLYCPTAKRTKCISKMLLLTLENLLEISKTATEIVNKISLVAVEEQTYYNKKKELQQEMSEKAKSVGLLKMEIDSLVFKLTEKRKLESEVKAEHEKFQNMLNHEQTALNQKSDLLKNDEEEVEKLEKEQICLLEEIVNSEEIELSEKLIVEIEKEIILLEEHVKGIEECLEVKEKELHAYEEVILKLEKIQNVEMSELEKLHKVRLNIQEIVDQISSQEKNLCDLGEAKLKEIEKNKQQEKQIKDAMEAFSRKKEELLSKIQKLKEKKKQYRKHFAQLDPKEKDIKHQIDLVDEKFENLNKNYEDTLEEFQEACTKIIISGNNTTEMVKQILNDTENDVFQINNMKN